MKYWLMTLSDMFLKDDFFVALLTVMLLLSCACIVTLLLRNALHERQLRRHSHIRRP